MIEHGLRLDQQLRRRNTIAVVSFLLPTYLPPSSLPPSLPLPPPPSLPPSHLPFHPVARAKARASSKENRKIHRASSVARVIISRDSVLNDSRKDLAKEVNMDLARLFYLGAARSFDSELFETVVRQADVVLDCVWCDSNSWWCRSSADSG